MARSGVPAGKPIDATDLSVCIVASRWHEDVMAGLVAGAQAACDRTGAQWTLVRVPGTFELPVVAAHVATAHDAVVALGVVVRGGTPHFEYVCRAATDGLGRVALDTGKPVGFGVLTCDDLEQALARSGLPGSVENKGDEAASAALETAVTLRELTEARRGRHGLGFGQ